MPEHREDRRFGTRYLVGNVAYVIPGFILFGIAFFRIKEAMDFDVISILLLIGFLACIIWGVVYDYLRFRNYHCPQCGSHIPKQTVTDQKIEYHCPQCDIIWDTMLRNGGE